MTLPVGPQFDLLGPCPVEQEPKRENLVFAKKNVVDRAFLQDRPGYFKELLPESLESAERATAVLRIDHIRGRPPLEERAEPGNESVRQITPRAGQRVEGLHLEDPLAGMLFVQ